MSKFPKNVGDIFRKRGDSRPAGSMSLARPVQRDTRQYIVTPCGGGTRTLKMRTTGLVTARNIVKYKDGVYINVGSALPTTAYVESLTWYSDPTAGKTYVVAGGTFTSMGGVAVGRIARWDGTAWEAMGDGFDGTVHEVVRHNGRLYAFGSFTQTGAVARKYCAVWNDAAGTWDGIGGGEFNAEVYCAMSTSPDGVVGEGYVFIGGAFTQFAGVLPTFYAARYNDDFDAMVQAFDGFDFNVTTMSQYDSNHIACGGDFENMNSFEGGAPTAAWHLALGIIDVNQCTTLGGLSQPPQAMCQFINGNGVYAGGTFTSDLPVTKSVRYFAEYPPGNELPNTWFFVYGLHRSDDGKKIYIGGENLIYANGELALNAAVLDADGNITPIGAGLPTYRGLNLTTRVYAFTDIPESIGGGIMIGGLMLAAHSGGAS